MRIFQRCCHVHAAPSFPEYLGQWLKGVSVLCLFVFISVSLKSAGHSFNLEFDKGGNYSVRVSRIGRVPEGDSLRQTARPDVLSQPDRADSHLLFEPLTDYSQIYGDSGRLRRDFETQQVLEGTVENTEGRESVVVMALNCKTGRIFHTYARKDGKFAINVNEFADSTVFNIDAYDDLDKRRKYDLSLTESPVPNIPAPATVAHVDNTTLYSSFDSARVLKNIEVTGRKKEAMNNFKIDPTRGYFEGDPAIYRHTNLSSLLRSMGVYSFAGATILLDNQMVQRSTGSEEEAFDDNIDDYLNSININDIWQVEYIKNDPRTMMFQSAQNAKPVLLIYTKLGAGGRRAMGRPLANSFTPKGYEPNVFNRAEDNDDNLIMWMPELIVKEGEKVRIDIGDMPDSSGIAVSVKGFTESGELIDNNFTIL